MAEVVAFRNNALPYPCYGLSYTVVFPLLDADGDPVSPSSPDSERSLNGDTFADCTNEAVEIATSTGICYLILTAAEMTADIVSVRIQSTGAKTTILTLYPRKLVVLSTGTCQGSNDTGDIQLASGDSAVDDIWNGCLCVAVIDSVTEARIINDYVGGTRTGEVSPAWVTAQPDSNDTYTIYLPEGRQLNMADLRATGGTAYTAGAIPAAVAGAAGGIMIAGSNAAATFASLTCTGGFTISDGIVVTCSTTNKAAFSVTGNGTGSGFISTGGATGIGISAGAAGNYGVHISGSSAGVNIVASAGNGFQTTGSQTGFYTASSSLGYGMEIQGKGTGGYGINITTSAANGINIAPTGGHGINIAANGTSMHGILSTGGTAGTSDGLKLVAGSGGVGFRLDTLTASGAVTLSGAVSLGSTLGITGAITATNASNNITLGTFTVTTNAIAWNSAWDAEVQSEAQDAITASALATAANLATVAGYLDTEIAAIKVVTDAIGTTGTGLSAIPWNASWDTEVQSECADALVAYDGLVPADLPANFAALGITAGGKISGVVLTDTLTTYTGNTLQTANVATLITTVGVAGAGLTDLGGMSTGMKAQVESEANDALVVHRLDELLNADSDIDGAAPPTVGSVFHELMTKTAGSFTYDQATDSLEALRDRGDAAWTTATGFSTHTAADVWSVATRLLTAGTNIVLVKGVGVTGFTDLSAADVRTAVGLASANLDTQLADLPTNAELSTALAAADDAVLAAIGALNNLSAAQVNAQVLDVLNVDTFAEPSAPPAATATLAAKINWLGMLARNLVTQSTTEQKVFADNGSTLVATAPVSDSGTVFTRGEFA